VTESHNEGRIIVISFTDKAEVARAGSLFLKLLSLDELSNEGLQKSGTDDDSEVNAPLISLTKEMLELLDYVEPAAGRLLEVVRGNAELLDRLFPEVVAENAKYLMSRFEALRIEPAMVVKRFEKSGGFATIVMNAAEALVFGVTEIREELETRQRDLANREVPLADFPHSLMCAFFIAAAGCAVIGGIASGVGAAGAAAILATGGATASVFLSTIAAAASSNCF
jgi:hypothetical protein